MSEIFNKPSLTVEQQITLIKTRKRYSLAELLHGVKPKKMKALNKKTKWVREGNSQGRELT